MAPPHCTRERYTSFARRVFCAQAGPHLPHPAQRIARNLSTLYRVHSLSQVDGACRRLRHRFMRCLHSRCVLPHLLTQSGIADGAATQRLGGYAYATRQACGRLFRHNKSLTWHAQTHKESKQPPRHSCRKCRRCPRSSTHTHTVHVRPNTPAAMRRVLSAICRTTAWKQGEATRAFKAPGDD